MLRSAAVTMRTFPKNLEGSITILGETGSVKIGGVAVNEIQTWDFADRCDYDDEVNLANYETTSVYGFGHPLYYKNIIDVMCGRAEPETDGREGLKSLEFLTAAYLAARDGGSVTQHPLLKWEDIILNDFIVHETAIVDPTLIVKDHEFGIGYMFPVEQRLERMFSGQNVFVGNKPDWYNCKIHTSVYKTM